MSDFPISIYPVPKPCKYSGLVQIRTAYGSGIKISWTKEYKKRSWSCREDCLIHFMRMAGKVSRWMSCWFWIRNIFQIWRVEVLECREQIQRPKIFFTKFIKHNNWFNFRVSWSWFIMAKWERVLSHINNIRLRFGQRQSHMTKMQKTQFLKKKVRF